MWILMKVNLALMLALAAMNSARADVIVDIRSTTIALNGTGTVDVYISSSPGQSTLLSFADYRFRIVPVGNVSGELIFLNEFQSSSPNDPQRQNNSEQTDPNYVFAGLTDAAHFGATIPNGNATELGGGDYATAAIDSSSVNVTLGSTPLLLARLEIAQRQTVVGDTFRVELSLDPNFTSFQDTDFNSANFSQSGAGLITVTAVPEPSTSMLFGLAMVTGWKRVRRRFRIRKV